MKRSFRSVCAVALPLLLVSSFAWAQSYPTKPVRLVIPYPPGSTPDIVGRSLADRLQKTKALMEGFTAAVEDLAKAQITLLAARGGIKMSIGPAYLPGSPAQRGF